MSILGSQNAAMFLKKLDEHKLLNICTDILTIDGHNNIRIMDGPGDGQRDIHSIDSNGNKCLTQSKYHNDIEQSIAAKELGEVVLGMVRFGYKHGIFITNTKISPQAKRDCLDDFPAYTITYLEGWEIVKKVFDNLILKAIWYDGQSLEKVSYNLIIPILARNLENDKPLPILPVDSINIISKKLVIDRSEVIINYQRNNSSTFAFGEYRSSETKTTGEKGSTRVILTEGILSGIIHLEDVEKIMDTVGEETILQINTINPDVLHYAVILGCPSLTPLGGELSGARIDLKDYKSRTIVVHGDYCEKESDWLLPKNNTEWILPYIPKTSQADWIRWYNSTNDICLDIMIECPPSDEVKWLLVAQRNYFIKMWKDSLFMLVPLELTKIWQNNDVAPPTKTYKWDAINVLCVWLHPNFNSPLVELPIENEYGTFQPIFEDDIVKGKVNFEKIRKRLESLGGIFEDPEKSRHMIAILEGDPYPNIEYTQFHCKHLAYDIYTIPTPIDPASRSFQFTVCWDVISTLKTEKLSNQFLDELLNELESLNISPCKTNVFLDAENLSKIIFIIFEIEYLPDDKFKPTEQILEKALSFGLRIIEQVESFLASKVKFNRATRKYWDKELLMTFKCN